jgi:tetratricopeptide (TPR) repeat protein
MADGTTSHRTAPMPSGRRRFQLPASLLVLCLIGSCGDAQQPVLVVPVQPAIGSPGAQARDAPSVKGKSYERQLGDLRQAIASALRQIDQQPDNAAPTLDAIELILERARLTGMLEDYQLARTLLDALATSGAQAPSTCQLQARLDFVLHRLPAASAALARCSGQTDLGEAATLSADIAFYSGRYKEAEDRYRALLNQLGDPSQYIRLALYRSKTGSPGEAAALMEAAQTRYHGGSATTLAWLILQRGLIAWERGRLDEALALYRMAADALPGWWLVDEQIADILRLQGDSDGARQLLEGLVARTGLPQHMDELARLLREGNTPGAALPWIARAKAIHNERLAAFPEAAVGHAVTHYLLFGTPAEALALAKRNVMLRPYGDAQIALAAALFRSGIAGDAVAIINRVQESGWDTAQLHAVSAQIHAALGRNTEADAQRARALAMNPHAMRLYLVAPPMQPELG